MGQKDNLEKKAGINKEVLGPTGCKVDGQKESRESKVRKGKDAREGIRDERKKKGKKW